MTMIQLFAKTKMQKRCTKFYEKSGKTT